MHPWRQLTRGVRALLRRGPTDQAVADEVEHYLAEAAAAHRARGLPDHEALRAARVELGGVTQSRESIRSVGWEIGALVGAVGAAFTSQLVSSMLFGVSPLNPVTFLSVLAIVALAALLACSLPAWRASRVDPVHALRAE